MSAASAASPARSSPGPREDAPSPRVDLPALATWAAVLLASLVFGLASQAYLSLTPLFCALLVLPWIPDRARPKIHLLAYVAVGAVFVVWQQTAVEIRSGLGATRFHGVYFAGYTCLVSAALALANPRRVRIRLPMAALFGLAGLCFAGGGLPNWLANQDSWRRALPLLSEGLSPRHAYALAVGLYTVLTLAALRGALPRPPPRAGDVTSRRDKSGGRGWRIALLGLAAATALGLIEGAAATTRSTYGDLSQAYLNLVRGLRLSASGGFSGQAEFGDVLAEQGLNGGRGVALEVFAREVPGYLRGRAFLRYTGRGWDVGENQAGIGAEQDDLGRWLYPGRSSPTEPEPALRVRPADRYEAVFFAPLSAQALDCAGEKLRTQVGSVLHPLDAPSSGGYRVWLDSAPLHVDAKREDYLVLPSDPALIAALDAHIDAAGLRGLPLPELCARLAKHFEARYEYKFGIQFEEGSDPLTQFLTVKKHGHCELFASSGALILRRLGHRARYVTGFVCTERNAYDPELWIARNRMAHAWVEAYHPSLGWQTLEFTPSSGLPAPGQASWSEGIIEWLQGKWSRLKAIPWGELPGYLAGQLKELLLWLVGAWWRVGLLLAAIVAFVLWRRARRPALPPVEVGRAFSPPLAAAREVYLEGEALLAIHGLERAPAETLLAEAERLRAVAWPPEAKLSQQDALARVEALAALRYAPEAGARGSDGGDADVR